MPTSLIEPSDVTESPNVATSKPPLPTRKRSASNKAHHWTRLAHVYTSMIAFIVVLFFALTGITLNHPDWAFGTSPTRSVATGTLPANTVTDGVVDWLNVAEYFRNTKGVRGSVADHRGDDTEGSISFKGPGYQADATFKMDSRSYQLVTESQGWVGVINDLHKGRDTRRSWKWLIDVAGGFLAFVSLSGLVLQFFLRKRRRSAYATAFAGLVFAVVLTWMVVQ